MHAEENQILYKLKLKTKGTKGPVRRGSPTEPRRGAAECLHDRVRLIGRHVRAGEYLRRRLTARHAAHVVVVLVERVRHGLQLVVYLALVRVADDEERHLGNDNR